jgi:hypothetical protein
MKVPYRGQVAQFLVAIQSVSNQYVQSVGSMSNRWSNRWAAPFVSPAAPFVSPYRVPESDYSSSNSGSPKAPSAIPR